MPSLLIVLEAGSATYNASFLIFYPQKTPTQWLAILTFYLVEVDGMYNVLLIEFVMC